MRVNERKRERGTDKRMKKKCASGIILITGRIKKKNIYIYIY